MTAKMNDPSSSEKEKKSSWNNTTTTTTTTTRVCIKNLPPSYTESNLRQHLLSSYNKSSNASSATFVITDCKVLKTKEGKSRKIAFVGFKSPDMAEQVISYFHNTYAQTSKLSVQAAFSKKGTTTTTTTITKTKTTGGGGGKEGEEYRPWSKYSQGSSRYEKAIMEEEKKKGIHNDNMDDDTTKKDSSSSSSSTSMMTEEERKLQKKKEEFVSTMMGESKSKASSSISSSGDVVGGDGGGGGGKGGKFWSNDDSGLRVVVAPPTTTGNSNDDENKNNDSDSSSSSSSSSTKDNDNDSKLVDDKVVDKSKKQREMSDMDFLRSKMVEKKEILSDSDDSSSSSDDSDTDSDDDSSSIPSSSESDDSVDDDDNKEERKSIARKKGSTTTTSFVKETNFEQKKGEFPPVVIEPTDRLFLRNLPFSATEEEITDFCSEYAGRTVLDCYIPIDDTKRNKGYAFVKFASTNDAAAALQMLDGVAFQGRLLHALPAREDTTTNNNKDSDGTIETGGGGGGGEGREGGTLSSTKTTTTHKRQMELARQKDADKNTKGLSSNFVRGDAIVDNLASRLGLSKGDVLNVKDGLSSENAAVRLALGETHVIEENRSYFRNHGVDMDILISSNGGEDENGGGCKKRSNDMILVKNLPFSTTHDEISKVFHSAGGDTPTILLPPSRTIALAQYSHSNDAKRAFRKLAYKRFKHVPLYLEWAPLLSKMQKEEQEKDSLSSNNTEVPAPEEKKVIDDTQKDMNDEDEITNDEGGSCTLYVKNLNFNTSEDDLQNAFENSSILTRSVRIPTKAAATRGKMKEENNIRAQQQQQQQQQQLSMGYGFVECQSEESARKALKLMQGKLVDGHAIEISISKIKTTEGKVGGKTSNRKSTKLICRNVPFQASRGELLKLFGSYGQLKNVRLPKKFDGGHRGFAFVEFVTGKEAQNAMKALSQTHLYGRHLVLEWAEDKDNVDTLRDKAKRDAISINGVNTNATNKKIRFD